MAEIALKTGVEYRKINGVLVKFHPETEAGQVLVGNYTGQTNLAGVISDIDTRIQNITGLDALVFKGVVDGSHALPASGYAVGDVYRVAAAGTYAGQVCEIGDMITCVATEGANSDWIVSQTNIDGAVVGPASATNERIAVYDGTTGKLIKDGGMTIAELQAEIDSDVATHAAIQATGSVSGHVTLSDATDSTSDASAHVAATPAAVKAAKDAADAAQADIDAHEAVVATASVSGHVTLSDAVDSTSGATSSIAATPAAVKIAKDAADAAQADADALETRMDAVEQDLADLGEVQWAMVATGAPTDTTDVSNLAEGGAYIVYNA